MNAPRDIAGTSVGVADLNGDGLADLVIAAQQADPFERNIAGRVYVVFSRRERDEVELPLASIATGDGTRGFTISGGESDKLGLVVNGAGDVNGDGIADLRFATDRFDLGAPRSDRAYVVYGTPLQDAALEVSDIEAGDGSVGVVIPNEVMQAQQTGLDRLLVSDAGDVNGDGVDDLLFANTGTAPNAEKAVHIVYGRPGGFGPELSLAEIADSDGALGVRILGLADEEGRFAGAITAAGDVDGDGRTDVAVATGTRVYLVRGQAAPLPSDATIDELVELTGGTTVVDEADSCRITQDGLTAGDFNGDGLSDIAFGCFDEGVYAVGATYVLFGNPNGLPEQITLAALGDGVGGDGAVLIGRSAYGYAGRGIAAGDINGDGVDELVVGASIAYSLDRVYSGQVYVVYGLPRFPQRLSVSDLLEGDGSAGFVINGASSFDSVGLDVAVADVDGDQIEDLVIGAYGLDRPNYFSQGGAYVIYGRSSLAVDGFVDGTLTTFVSCQNLRTGEAQTLTLSEPALETSWSCGELGVSLRLGDDLRLIAGGRATTRPFRGFVTGLATSGTVLCSNLTREIDVVSLLSKSGGWSCDFAGLPTSPGDRVRVVVSGQVDRPIPP
ncbi:MAG: hypothetical protein AAGA68_19445 [Pseudomonadota bacterium]